MKKILKTLVVFCAVFCILPAFAGCGQIPTTGNMTGGACSIKQLNLENEKAQQGKVGSQSMMKVDLRPVRRTQEIRKNENPDCILGSCLYKTILNK